MKFDESKRLAMSRRRFLALTGGAVAAAGASALAESAGVERQTPVESSSQAVPFWGSHQAGILTPAQRHTYFAAFDVSTANRKELGDLFRRWTAAAARLAAGQSAEAMGEDLSVPAADSGEAVGLAPARLTLTFGLGAGIFVNNGADRFGLAARRPAALIDLPRFNGDQLVAAQSGGDLSVQACADDPQVAFHAVRQLARLAYGVAEVRWAQTGFLPEFGPGETPRNLMGFKDGTGNPSLDDAALMDKFVWSGREGPGWMEGGTYVVVRRVRMALEHWDQMAVGFQEQAIGRKKYSGAGLGGKNEFDAVDLNAVDGDGNSIVPDNAHVRLGMPASNDGARILRRPYSYNDGVNFTSERWPPWRQGMEYDAGLFFLCYQRDVRSGFVKIFEQMSKIDMLNQFLTHTSSGVFAIPPGVAEGHFLAEGLFADL
jgi:deferrochelatase/peroxidase EfeB